MLNKKNVIKNTVSKKSTQVELIDGHKKIDTQQRSQQLAQVSMSSLLQVLSVEKQSDAQNTEWVANLKMYTSYVFWNRKQTFI